MSDLANKKCVPCNAETPTLREDEISALAVQVPEWEVVGGHHLGRRYSFRNFREALRFVNRVGELAEEQGHHPEIGFGWGYANLRVWTHAIDGLSENDFVLAAKVDALDEESA
ncbi:MAG: 4a-hydroxytetrahydrobiopterin dehydratase [Actinomycetota bacterium]|nr:4a-hydroxytetrahydrobiopterin dehydratase [Actinomycetota bacterium]MDP9485227.1 4a-hydroxytetrahydrobiopterin dehydratase [Actinomycetota bacterium]PLS84534.1 MAG: 4a-hydroxytetrahydrobiopterin dehydratase [Actinomycetota bacterium]